MLSQHQGGLLAFRQQSAQLTPRKVASQRPARMRPLREALNDIGSINPFASSVSSSCVCVCGCGGICGRGGPSRGAVSSARVVIESLRVS